MALRSNIRLAQSQKLALSPQLLQSIQLLQMNAVELQTFVQNEVDENPILDLVPYPENHATLPVSSGNEPVNHGVDRLADQISLFDHLNHQIAMAFAQQSERNIATAIISNLDEDGYFREDVDLFCKKTGYDFQIFSQILSAVQRFDPVGIAATDLRQCLIIQLRELGQLSDEIKKLLSHLDYVARGRFDDLCKMLKIDQKTLNGMIATVQNLNPRPALQFDNSTNPNVIADVVVKQTEIGKFKVELNPAVIPKLLINREYYAEIRSMPLGAEDKQFMVDKLQRANWLVATLDQRAQSILSVATHIVSHQSEFFKHGEEYLRPLTLNTLASLTHRHESTMSRIVSQRYLMSEKGLFPFRYFLMQGVGKSFGNQTGSRAIKAKLKRIIDLETSSSVSSDKGLVDKLAGVGIQVARRTIAKYRNEMNIPGYSIRKRKLRAALNEDN